MKRIYACLLCLLNFNAFSQNVGINTTVPSAYGHGGNNKLLEIYNDYYLMNAQAHLILADSSVSGAVGSVTWGSRAITNSEKRVGIISSQFDVTATAASPKSYLRFYTHNGAGIAENFTINPTGNVGIGVVSPFYKLHLGHANSSLRIEGPSSASTGGAALSIGGYGDVIIDKPGVEGGRFIIKENGNIGINNNNPTVPLAFPPFLGKKITLYPGTTGDVGFGVAGNRLQIYADNPNADVALGYDAAGTFNERFAVKPTGALAVNGNVGSYGQLMMSGGTGSALWMSPSQIISPFFMNQTAAFVIPNLADNPIPGAVMNVSVPVSGKLVIWPSVRSSYACANPLDACTYVLRIITLVDGNEVNDNFIQGQSQVAQLNDDKQIGPIVVSLAAGNHAVNFHEVFTTAGLIVMQISAFAQFYPD